MASYPEFISLMDPTGKVPTPAKTNIAERLTHIEDACIGILSNQKPNVDPFLNELGRILVDEYRVGKIIKQDKLNQSLPAEKNIIDTLVACDAVVHGVGD